MECKLTARVECQNPRHAQIGVWQNGGKAGTLHVEREHAKSIVRLLNVVLISSEEAKSDVPEA